MKVGDANDDGATKAKAMQRGHGKFMCVGGDDERRTECARIVILWFV